MAHHRQDHGPQEPEEPDRVLRSQLGGDRHNSFPCLTNGICVRLLQFTPTPQGEGLAEVCNAIGRGPQIGQGKKVEKVSLKRKMENCDEKGDEGVTSDGEAPATDTEASEAVASDGTASVAGASVSEVVASHRATVTNTRLAMPSPSSNKESPASPVQASSLPQLFSNQFTQHFPPQFSQPFSHPFSQPFSSQFTQPFPPQISQPFSGQFTQPFPPQISQPFPSQFYQPFPSQFTQPYPNQFSQPFSNQFTQPLPSQFTQPFPNQILQPFSNQFTHPFTSQFTQPLPNQFSCPQQPFNMAPTAMTGPSMMPTMAPYDGVMAPVTPASPPNMPPSDTASL